MKESEKKQTLTQAELFGVEELAKVTRDPKSGIGTLPSAVPDPGIIEIPASRKAEDMKPEHRAKMDAYMKALSETFKDVIANHDEGTPVGASPLPWHWEEGGGGTINVYDANNNCVFDNINGGEIYSDRDWENVELMVACVNKFAASISAEHLDRLRKKQVYGDENYDEEAAFEEARKKIEAEKSAKKEGAAA